MKGGTLVQAIQAAERGQRDAALEDLCRGWSRERMEAEAEALHLFQSGADNLYQRVRALAFLYAIHRFHLPPLLPSERAGRVPWEAQQWLLQRRFGEAVEVLRRAVQAEGMDDALSSALARAYHQMAFQNLANQVRRSVREVRGNRWMYRCGHPEDYPLRIHPSLRADPAPILLESTAVRMDLSHSGWSDIFFLGMDFPEGARVLNVSIDLAVMGRDSESRPPIQAALRLTHEPGLRLVSVDLGMAAEIRQLSEVFDFARDHLGLLKAALIASGLIPIGLEGSGQSLGRVLEKLLGPGRGLELVSCVHGIPKGSRLAVSTNLLAALIAVLMRATSQIASLAGPLTESERRLVASRAILGEWLGGSGGGWQDSGGIWPGIKVIAGSLAAPGDPEFGVSRGRLLPSHRILDEQVVSRQTRQRLQDSLILVHGGMAQNVGPVLEMVTERYLLRSASEWEARRASIALFDQIQEALAEGDIRRLGALTTEHFFGPLQTIIPWASNAFTERVIERTRTALGEDFWGFWMLGGLSGGGMGFIVAPHRMEEARHSLLRILRESKRELECALPFAMDPVVYRFAINPDGTRAQLLEGKAALMPSAYYPLVLPDWLRRDPRALTAQQRAEVARLSEAARSGQGPYAGLLDALVRNLLPPLPEEGSEGLPLEDQLALQGFDPAQHERVRTDLRAGLIGLAQNRLPANTTIEDVAAGDVFASSSATRAEVRVGEEALARGEVAVLSLAAGVGSRWTQGAGVVKALHPFCRLGGKHRSFLEVHLAKSRRTGELFRLPPVHIFSTSHLTHRPIDQALRSQPELAYRGTVLTSLGRSIGLRLIPMERDLRFAWEETPQQRLDERAQKVRESLHQALCHWCAAHGGEDYRDNLPAQCMHPVGHWYEVPNLLLNGTLRQVLQSHPGIRTLFLHNIDTVGADLDPAILGSHRRLGGTLSFEVTTRRVEDRGGGLARVNGRVRLVEGLALPRESDEHHLSFYNTLSCWIEIDPLLSAFGLSRDSLADLPAVAEAVRSFSRKLPTYITLKEVKKRWGHGQEDIFPVAQFERLWGDMSALPDVDCRFLLVPRTRGQQLKDVSQLDGWVREGAAARVNSLCCWA